MSASDLNRAQYVGIDFLTALDEQRARIQVKYASTYNDFAVSALGMLLLDTVAFGVDTLGFYLDRRATDSYLATARTRKSVARLSRQLGYKMRSAVSSSVDLQVTIASPGFDVTIPKGLQFSGPNNLVFENSQAQLFAASDPIRTKTISCYEGVSISESFVSDGTSNQVFKLQKVPSGSFMVSGTVSVLVNGGSFTESEFITFDQTDQYEIGYNDDPPTVRFGNGQAGNIPVAGASISVSYVASRGKSGLVSSGTISSSVVPLIVSFQQISMSINNPLGSVGGDDPEDLAHVKVFAPLVYKSRQVTVTKPDYDALAGSFADPLFGQVAIAKAVSSRTAAGDALLVDNTAAIRGFINDPLKVASDSVQLTGTVQVSSATGVVSGSLTTFATDLSAGSFISFSGGDTTVYRVVSSPTTNFSVSILPIPAADKAAGTLVYRHGSAITKLKTQIKSIDADRQTIATAVAAIATAAHDSNTVAVAATADANSGIDSATAALVSVGRASAAALDISTTLTTNTVDNLTPMGNIYYLALDPTYNVQQLAASGAGSVSIVSTLIQITPAAGANEAAVVAQVNASSASSFIVAFLKSAGAGAPIVAGPTPVKVLIPAAVRTTLVTDAATATSFCSAATSSMTTVNSKLSDLISGTNSFKAVTTHNNAIGVDTATSGYLTTTIASAATAIQTLVGTTTSYAVVPTDGDTITTEIAAISGAVVDNSSNIGTPLQLIYDHVDAVLSQDCKANLVTVPILARDRSGFFTTPSVGLIRSLQSYLDVKKEVTQTVQVVSGASKLIGAVISIRVGVNPSYSESLTQSAAATAVDSVLRDRKFGANLYVSELDTALQAIAGISFYNVDIIGPTTTASLDATGNLIIPQDCVITKGTVTITTETVSVV